VPWVPHSGGSGAPAPSRAGSDDDAPRDASLRDFAAAPTLLAIGGTIVFYIAVGGIWPFAYELGVRAGFDGSRSCCS